LKKNVTYIISDINSALAFEWIAEYLDKERINISFVLLNPGDSILEQYLVKNNVPVTRIICRGKKDWPAALLAIYKKLKRDKPHIVHCHLQQACILGLLAAKVAGIQSRVHTRHHSSLHHVYIPKGVLWDKMINKLSTRIIAISGQVKKILVEWEHVPENKIVYIPHGFLLNIFKYPDPKIVAALKEQYISVNAGPVVGVISRFTEWKGVQYIVPAFAKVRQQYPAALLLLFNAGGDYAAEINALLQTLPHGSYKTIPFEKNIAAAYHLMDVFVHTPVDEYSEAFGQTYIESMAAGVPLVATLSGIGKDILTHKQNAWVAAYKNAGSIAEGILCVLSDKQLKETLINNAGITADLFSLQNMINSLTALYDSD
jgi:glycosyltransferase involved in cell wall biosynthesis